MDYDSIFKKLTRGARFDRKKYREDAENLGIIPKVLNFLIFFSYYFHRKRQSLKKIYQKMTRKRAFL